MILPLYLAMTAAEISACSQLPDKIAYMSCHFSSYGTGLSNLPDALPAGSMVMLNDRIPVSGHDPKQICQQLQTLCQRVEAAALVLDLQRPGDPLTREIVECILQEMSCPVAVSDTYAEGFECPVFLSAPPIYKPLQAHIAPWQGRQIWLEAAPEGCCCTVTENSIQIAACPVEALPLPCPELFCHYQVEEKPDRLEIRLSRSEEDLSRLLENAEINLALGLYQQLGAAVKGDRLSFSEENT